MVLGEAGAAFVAEMSGQYRRYRAEQAVALGKAVPAVEALEARQVKEQNRRICIPLPHPLAARIGQLVEIRHVRQARHVIVIGAAVLAFFLQKAVQRLVQHAFVGALVDRAHALVGVPGQAQAHPRLGINALAVGVQDDIIRAF